MSVDLKSFRRVRAHSDNGSVDRLPPHSLEAEQGVLGCVLLDPRESMPPCVERIRSASVFYDLRHQTIWEALCTMAEKRLMAIEVLTLHQVLKDRGQVDAVGGIAYLANLPDAVPSVANLEYYLNIVLEKAVLRRMIRDCTDIIGRTYEHDGEVDELLDEVEKTMLALSEDRIVQGQARTTKALVHEAIGLIEQYHQGQGKLTGLATGFHDLDRMTHGLHSGDMAVIAARPSVGKTSLAMNIAEHVAVDLQKAVGVFSLEMTAEQLVLRMLCSRARVNLRGIRDGFLSERDQPKLMSAAGKLASAPLYIDDTSGLSIMQLRAKARRMHQQHSLALLIIDYMQLLHSTNKRADNRQQEIADISSGVKALAKELRVPVVVLSQLNREVEKRDKGKPRLSDLRESGSIEQDADFVGLLYDPAPENEDEQRDARPISLLIAKQRNGPTGNVDLTFIKSYTRFESAARIASEAPGPGYQQPHND